MKKTNTPDKSIAPLVVMLQAIEIFREAIEAAGPEGVTGGLLYAASMQYGCTMEIFDKVMSILVESGKVKKHGHVYIAVPLEPS